MKRAVIPINNYYELELRYYERDISYKYFNRKFEIYLLKKEKIKRTYILHMDNCDTREGRWAPHIHKIPDVDRKLYFPATTINWNDIKKNLYECITSEIGLDYKNDVKKAIAKIPSPKI
ncbi:MAG: hypothetical protein QXS02_06435 [Candidatus Thermoplasmatota archaeon]